MCACTCKALSSQQREQVRKQERGRDEEADRRRERRAGGRELKQQCCARVQQTGDETSVCRQGRESS